MKRSILACAIAISVVAAGTASAGQHGRGGGPKPTSGQSAHGPKTSPAQGHGSAAGPKTTTHGASTATHGGGHSTPKTTKTTTTASTSPKSTKSTTTTTTVAGTATLSPVQQKLQQNTNLASKLQSRLPEGTDLMKAAADFRNLGQFVAAVNVSNNLGISFADLKTRMVTDGMSLGQAIQDLRPNADTTVVRRAESDADALIRSTETTTTKTKSGKSKAVPRKHGGD